MVHTAAAAAVSLSSGLATRKAVIMPESWQPVPVILPISGLPLRITKHLLPSATRSMAPVMAMMDPVSLARPLTNATALSSVSSVTASATSASTPLVVPLPLARVLISEILPRITSNLISFISPTAVLVRRAEAPAPTGSSRTTCPTSLALRPARYMPSILDLFSVPMLIFRPPQILVISSTSSGSSDIIGLPPQASRIFATSLTVT